MLYKTVSLAFCAQTAMGYAPAMPSKIASSRVARVSDIEMAKKSVGDLSEADLKGKTVLVRCDLNVPLDGKTITEGARPHQRIESGTARGLSHAQHATRTLTLAWFR